jgi:hypothetical protein
LTLVCPGNMDATALRPLASRLLVVNDDHPTGHGVTQAMAQLPDATLLTLPGYRGFPGPTSWRIARTTLARPCWFGAERG